MSYHRSYLDSPSLSTPPPSPWRTRAEQFRHRPVRLRQAVLLIAGFALFCTFALLSRQREANHDGWLIPDVHRTSETSLPFQNSHDHRPHHGSSRPPPPQVVDNHALSSELKLEDTHTIVVAAAPDPIVFSLIMFSEDSANEGAVLMKVCRNTPSRVGSSDHALPPSLS